MGQWYTRDEQFVTFAVCINDWHGLLSKAQRSNDSCSRAYCLPVHYHTLRLRLTNWHCTVIKM